MVKICLNVSIFKHALIPKLCSIWWRTFTSEDSVKWYECFSKPKRLKFRLWGGGGIFLQDLDFFRFTVSRLLYTKVASLLTFCWILLEYRRETQYHQRTLAIEVLFWYWWKAHFNANLREIVKITYKMYNLKWDYNLSFHDTLTEGVVSFQVLMQTYTDW